MMEGLPRPGVVFIIDHPKTSLDKSRNPLTGEERKAILRQHSSLRFEVVSSIPEALDVMDVLGMERHTLLCGDDRAEGYRHFAEEIIVLDRDTVSATLVRQTVLANDYQAFSELVLDPSCWDTLRRRLWDTSSIK